MPSVIPSPVPVPAPTSVPLPKEASEYCMEIAEANGCLSYEGGDLCGYAGECSNITFTGPTARPSAASPDHEG